MARRLRRSRGVGMLSPCRRLAAPVESIAGAAGAASASVTRRSAGTAIRRSRQARGPVLSQAAGIDAASMARRCHNPLQKLRRLVSSPAEMPIAARWVGARFAGATGATRASLARLRRRRARPARVARTSFHRTPAESRPFRPRIPTLGDAGETSPRPPRRPRNLGTREARTLRQREAQLTPASYLSQSPQIGEEP